MKRCLCRRTKEAPVLRSAATDAFRSDLVDLRFLPADSNAYQHHFDLSMFKYLTPTQTNFPADQRWNVHCRDQVFQAVIVNIASSLVTADAVPFALQNTLADGQYVQQYLGRLQADSRTDTLKITDRNALGPGDDVSPR